MIFDITSDPNLARCGFKKRLHLLTDCCKLGCGYTLCQLNNDPDSITAMKHDVDGDNFEFLRPKSKLLLRTIGF
jgi:hypothetical protein